MAAPQRGSERLAWALFVAALAAARVLACPRVPDGHDALYFVRALDRFSVHDASPHWPGYPVYVLAGRALRRAVGDGAWALHLVSVAASVAALAPLTDLARRWAARLPLPPPAPARAAWLAAVAWAVVPYTWLTGSQILSDPLGLLLALSVLAACDRLAERPSPATLAAAWLGAGLLLGVRLAYAGLLVPLAWVTWRVVRAGGPRAAAVAAGGLAAGAAPWLCWQLAVDAGGLLRGAPRTLAGHFQAWGGTAYTDRDLVGRLEVVVRGWVLDGLGLWAQSVEWRGLAFAVPFLLLAGAGLARLRRAPRDTRVLFLLWAVPYAASAFLVLDAAQPRYGLPLAAVACVVVGLGVPRGRVPALATGVLLAGGGLAVSVPLALSHREGPPGLRLVRRVLADGGRVALLHDAGPSVSAFLLLPEAARVEWAAVSAETATARARALREAGHEVYSTVTPQDAPEDWRPLARFCGRPALVADEEDDLWLFRYAPGAPPAPPPPCS
jgi:hypothetical protein